MAVYHAPETPHAKELWKWDHFTDEVNPYDSTIRGVKPRGFQPYPAMLYKASRNPLGQVAFEPFEVHSEDEQRNMESRGYVAGGAGKAMEALLAQESSIATMAAERAYQERGMSEAARREAAAVDDATDGHVPSIPETPIRRRPGRPKNAADSAV